MNKKGFIATSIIYSFFLIFITLFLTIIADYLQDKVLLNSIEQSIKKELNNGMSCNNFNSDDQLIFRGNYYPGINLNMVDKTGDTLYIVCRKDCDNNKLIIVEENNDCLNDSDIIEIDMGENVFTKETSDHDYYIITGVRE